MPGHARHTQVPTPSVTRPARIDTVRERTVSPDASEERPVSQPQVGWHPRSASATNPGEMERLAFIENVIISRGQARRSLIWDRSDR